MNVKELGHIALYVRNIEPSRRFYGQILGWQEILTPEEMQGPFAGFTSGRTHHELLLIQVGDDATPTPRGRHLGLYHVGIKVGTSDQELQEALDTCRANGVTIVGTSNEGPTHSLYILDPDGNELEPSIGASV
jgi:catechol 2,3-dioxygenase